MTRHRSLIGFVAIALLIGLGLPNLTAAAADGTEPPTTEPTASDDPTSDEQTTEPVIATEPPVVPAPTETVLATEPQAEPSATEPVTTDPVTTDPVTTEPVTTEPVTTEPTTNQPATEPSAPPSTEAVENTAPVTTEPSAPPSSDSHPESTPPTPTDPPAESSSPGASPSTPVTSESATTDISETAPPSISPLSIIGGSSLFLEGWCDGSTFVVSLNSPNYDSIADVEGYPDRVVLPPDQWVDVIPEDVDGDGWIDVHQYIWDGIDYTIEEFWTVSIDACRPSAPSLAAAVGPTSGMIELTWSAPNNGGASISDYTIQRSTDGSEWTTINDGVRSTTGYTATGLTNGTRYYFRVLAENEAGTGPWSNVTNAVPRTVPSPVRSLTATPGNRAVTLRWTAPASNGGAAITDYVIQRSPNGTTGWLTINDEVNTAYTVTGLTNGTRYYFRVLAKNAAGNSPSSNVANAIAGTVPSAPRSLTATPGSRRVTLKWVAPASNGGAPITAYTISYAPSGGTWRNINVAANAQSNILTGLLDGTRYYFRVSATNAVGRSSWTTNVNATPRSVPSVPRSLTVALGYFEEPQPRILGYDRVTLRWTVPALTGGSPITGYRISYAPAGGTWRTINVSASSCSPLYGCTGTGRTYVVTGLRPHTTYSFRIAAYNAVGQSPSTSSVRATTLTQRRPSAPVIYYAVGVYPFYLLWDPPSDTGGLPILRYTMQVRIGDGPWTSLTSFGGSTRDYTVPTTGQRPLTKYCYRIAAVNSLGVGPWSVTPACITLPP